MSSCRVVDAVYRAFGERLRKQRQQAHLTQEQLATRVGLSRTSITNIEKGTQHISLHLLLELAKALGVSPAALLPEPPVEDTLVPPEKVMRTLSERDQEWVLRVLRARTRVRPEEEETNGES